MYNLKEMDIFLIFISRKNLLVLEMKKIYRAFFK